MKKATIEALLERKTKQDKASVKTIELKSLDMSFNAVKLPLGQLLSIMDKYDVENGSYSEKFGMFKELVYMSIPIFRDSKLIEAYEVVEPEDVVTAVLNDDINAVTELATAVMEMYGLTDGSAVTELKN